MSQVPQITALPPAPRRSDAPEDFSAKADALAAAQPGFVSQANELAEFTNQRATTAGQAANTASDSATAAAASAQAARSSETLAANSANTAVAKAAEAVESASSAQSSAQVASAAAQSAGVDAQAVADGLASIAGGPVASVAGSTGVVTKEKLGDAGVWTDLNLPADVVAKIGEAPKLVRSARTSNVQLTANDNGRLIDITSGTFTQTFAAASTLGNGWFCYLKNSGAGDITLAPNAPELIDGLTSYVMYPGESRLVQCDGQNLRTVVLNSFYKVFSVSGEFVKPPGYSRFEGEAWGGGAGSKWAANAGSYYQFSGAGGGFIRFSRLAEEISQSELVVVGAGGIRTTVWNSTQNAGGKTTFAGVTAFGGNAYGDGGGTADGINFGAGNSLSLVQISPSSVYTSLGFAGSPFRNATMNPRIPSYSLCGGGGAIGINGNSYENTYNADGGFSFYGAGAGASLAGTRGGSFYGGRGADASNPAEVPGGGGHAAPSTPYGDGARGELRIGGII